MISSLEAVIDFVIRNHSYDTLLAHTLYPLGIFVYNVVLTTEVSNEDFFNNLLIPAARLNDKNVENSVINPNAFTSTAPSTTLSPHSISD